MRLKKEQFSSFTVELYKEVTRKGAKCSSLWIKDGDKMRKQTYVVLADSKCKKKKNPQQTAVVLLRGYELSSVTQLGQCFISALNFFLVYPLASPVKREKYTE